MRRSGEADTATGLRDERPSQCENGVIETEGTMMDKPQLTRWHWRATVAPETRGIPAMQVEVHLEDLHIPADPDAYPYVEGHQLSLQWADPHYPVDHGRRNQREHFITEDFRQHEARATFWTEQITDKLLVRVGLAKPEARLGEDVTQDQVIRVSYLHDGHEWLVSQVNPRNPGLSSIIATEELAR